MTIARRWYLPELTNRLFYLYLPLLTNRLFYTNAIPHCYRHYVDASVYASLCLMVVYWSMQLPFAVVLITNGFQLLQRWRS